MHSPHLPTPCLAAHVDRPERPSHTSKTDFLDDNQLNIELFHLTDTVNGQPEISLISLTLCLYFISLLLHSKDLGGGA